MALEFTPLEFETRLGVVAWLSHRELEFTPLEFETKTPSGSSKFSTGLEFTPLEFETRPHLSYTLDR